MKKVLLITLLLTTLGVFSLALADSPTDSEKLEAVAFNCQKIKTNLRRIKINDSVARVQFGRNYESVLRNIMRPANARLVAAGYNASDLVQNTTDFSQQLDNFRQAYLTHETKLSDLIDADCVDEPAQFYENLVQVRQGESDLNKLARLLQAKIDDYQVEFLKVVQSER